MSEEQFSNVQSPQPPYAPPQSGGSGLATTSLVLGILSYLCCGPVCGIPAIITGHIALGKVRRGESPPSGQRTCHRRTRAGIRQPRRYRRHLPVLPRFRRFGRDRSVHLSDRSVVASEAAAAVCPGGRIANCAASQVIGNNDTVQMAGLTHLASRLGKMTPHPSTVCAVRSSYPAIASVRSS